MSAVTIRMDEVGHKGTALLQVWNISTLGGQTVPVCCVPLRAIACLHVLDGRSWSPLERVTLSRATLLIILQLGVGSSLYEFRFCMFFPLAWVPL